MGGLSNGPVIGPHVSLNPQIGGSRSLPVKLQPNFDENVIRVPFSGPEFMSLTIYSFHRSSKLVNADRTQYVWSLSGLITIVVMTLLTYLNFQGIYIYTLYSFELTPNLGDNEIFKELYNVQLHMKLEATQLNIATVVTIKCQVRNWLFYGTSNC